ncbi:hypothetical protein KAR91_31195 [Candidatus Pacearchaeota archaeon]|nr:hypothetical protein [Candidatus Pacearchaeota archaeon]
MKYYIEVKGWVSRRVFPGGPVVKDYKVLQEYSRVCEDRNYDWIKFLVVRKVKGFADKITVYPYVELNNFPDPIENCDEIKFPLSQSSQSNAEKVLIRKTKPSLMISAGSVRGKSYEAEK